jgi:hypothetical protein
MKMAEGLELMDKVAEILSMYQSEVYEVVSFTLCTIKTSRIYV